jgi:hypothetical protein
MEYLVKVRNLSLAAFFSSYPAICGPKLRRQIGVPASLAPLSGAVFFFVAKRMSPR